MAVDFRVLGEVQTRVDGRLVDLGHARQRCVLAALLVDANRVVPAGQLLDRIWGDRPPQRARATLSSYLSRLRYILAAPDDLALCRRPGGYLLSVNPMAVDLHRFRSLVVEARTTADPDLFERALAQWRGEAFTGLDTAWLSAVREALRGERRTAELDRNDLALARGRHAGLLGGLAAGAGAYPLDERVAGQYMLALYRCGRQADALARYEELRRQLADELGADPSPSLRALHRQILAADPALADPQVRGGTPVPRQLPASPRSFTGRASELAELDKLLANAETQVMTAVVSGTAGVGKTGLAVHWARLVADRFPDGQLYVNLRGFDPLGAATMSPADVVRGFLDALGVAPERVPTDLDSQLALYRSQLSGRRALVVLDNARDADQVRPLLPGTVGCLVLVTSRSQLTGLVAAEGAHPLALDPLTTTEARELLVARLDPARVAAAQAAVDEIVTRCAGLPLALCVAAARAVTRPHLRLSALADELRDAHHTLDALAGADPSTDLRAVFACSYRALGRPAARLFRLLALHPGPEASTAAAASLAAAPVAQIRPLLAELAEASLVVEHRPGRYTLHDLLRAYAAEHARRLDSDAERHAATHRMLDFYLYTAVNASRRLYAFRDPVELAAPQPGVLPEPFADDRAAASWYRAELPVLLTVVDHAATAGFDAHVCQLAWAASGYLDTRALWRDWVGTQRAALAAARRLGDRSAEAAAHRVLGRAYAFLGAHDDAEEHLDRALSLGAELGDRSAQARTHQVLAMKRVLAMMLDRRDAGAEALRHAHRALELLRAAGNTSGQAGTMTIIGWYHALRGDHGRALVYGDRALAMQLRQGNRLGQADPLHCIGFTRHRLGRHDRAIECYRRALELYRDLGGDPFSEALACNDLGDAHDSVGDTAAARRYWQRACHGLDEICDPRAEAVRAKLSSPPGRTRGSARRS